ncbi:hypothetical protein EZJ19_13105 [Parasulfuritortus cantonensis]|uniref:DUF4410 domain-containing protein n=1 Tax=Parasulfuritortus cantonensis TaxID=2528202 RepID=A0A4R1B346_9PROT|nr:hypothetical protein [Parasulfuritortus cantonensis]TCJ12271.1 hypothetical protein EZJ19_13105 [Parasulfuritortus cantonensis]
MKIRLGVAVLWLGLVGLAGCMPKSFVDPGLYQGGLKTAPRLDTPIPVELRVRGYTQGKENARATEFWTRQITKALDDSHALAPSASPGTARHKLAVDMDNVGDMGTAFGKGFMTGLTLGLVGSTVTDGYVMRATFSGPDGEASEHEYRHAIHSMIGNADPPQGVATMSPMEAAIQVVDDLVAHLLRDLKSEGRI